MELVDEIRKLYEDGFSMRSTHEELIRRGRVINISQVGRIIHQLGIKRTPQTGWKLKPRTYVARVCQRCQGEYVPNSAHQYSCDNCHDRRYYRYGLTKSQYVAMYEAQNGRCAICEKQFNDDRKDCIDHCHTTGRVRGLLCRYCNSKLVALEDNSWRQRAETYLQKS